jgi:phenylpropionate dioxygenase-like ring-hydroxylating dioxygenase large terminal subunit
MVDTQARGSQAPLSVEEEVNHQGQTGAKDRRRLIPELGLKEYWYPALESRKVGKKPVGMQFLGEQLVFFRGKGGDVSALWNVCPHRGGSLMHGNCHFDGTISCPYHGWTFDGDGNVLAVLPEGPESKIPGKVKARVYPTRTLRGMVFIWMGEGEPAPIEEDVPPEFFHNDGLVMYAAEVWPANWRLCVENVADAHVPYVHRDAVFALLVPMPLTGPIGAPTAMINNRYSKLDNLSFQALISAKDTGAPEAKKQKRKALLQAEFPALGGRWPKHQWRKLVSWSTEWSARKRFASPPTETNDEWNGLGRHLPAMVRIDYRTHVFTRVNVPVDADNTRQVYYHYSAVSSPLGKLWEKLLFHAFHRWAHVSNFSVQDFRAVEPQRFDTAEYLSSTDLPNVEWRRLVVRHARGLEHRDV